MEKNEIVVEKLKQFNLYESNINPQILEYLIQIQSAINQILLIRDEAINTYKSNKLSIKQISSICNVSRGTFYNNAILKEYVELSIEENIKKDIFSNIEDLREKIRKKDQIISRLVQRDAEIIVYKLKNEELKKELISLKKTIRTQELNYKNLVKQMETINPNEKKQSNITKFNDKSI